MSKIIHCGNVQCTLGIMYMHDYYMSFLLKVSFLFCSIMKAAACGTWLGDLITAFIVTDMMLQDNLYPNWAPSARYYNILYTSCKKGLCLKNEGTWISKHSSPLNNHLWSEPKGIEKRIEIFGPVCNLPSKVNPKQFT